MRFVPDWVHFEDYCPSGIFNGLRTLGHETCWICSSAGYLLGSETLASEMCHGHRSLERPWHSRSILGRGVSTISAQPIMHEGSHQLLSLADGARSPMNRNSGQASIWQIHQSLECTWENWRRLYIETLSCVGHERLRRPLTEQSSLPCLAGSMVTGVPRFVSMKIPIQYLPSPKSNLWALDSDSRSSIICRARTSSINRRGMSMRSPAMVEWIGDCEMPRRWPF